jgi:endonuclease YncB( thermonuclease family)
VVLVGAACLGVAVGLYEAAGPRTVVEQGAEIEWNAVAAPPVRAPEVEDLEWEGRAAEAEAAPAPTQVRGSAEAAPSVRATFGMCKWGGGTNCVVDGDTFWINGEKVRIAGIDAPETHDYGCESELALGDRATEKLQALLNSGAVTMTSIDRDRDVYGRLLRDVQVNGADVGAAMVSAGVARVYGRGRRPWC